MSKKLSDPSTVPEPLPADSFTVPSDGDAFSAPTPDQEVQLWTDLRGLLSGVEARARSGGKSATAEDRATANTLLARLGLASELAPLFLTAIREAADLEKIVAAGVGKGEEVEKIRREIQSYFNLSAADPATNQQNAAAREQLTAQHTAATRLAEGASRAERQLRHLHLWLWPLFTPEANPFPEVKNALGETIKQNRGALAGTIVAPQLDESARALNLDPFVIDSWRQLRRPEPTPPKRRFRTSPLSQPTTGPMFGRNL